MSGYLGQAPGIGQQQFFTFNCTAGQTSFSGTDSLGYTLNYNVGFVDVYLNGRRLTPISDFTATNGSSITLLAAASASDVLFVSALSQFSLANWVTNAVNYVFVATAGQSSFSGSDINGQTLFYVAGALQVSVNGIVLPQNDYAALNGSTVIIGSALNAGDIVQVFSLRTINPINISSWITNNLTNIADYTYIATQGQTSFGGAAYAGGTLAYKPNCIQVTVNGLVLTPADYTATSGTNVILNLGCNFDDTVVIRVFGNTTVAGVYTQAQSDSRYLINPTQTVYTSGSGTYTVPAGARWLKVRMIGAGGGGGGITNGVGYPGGTAGGNTQFGSVYATGGNPGNGSTGGAGGSGGAGTASLRISGATGTFAGGSTTYNIFGGPGASSPFGGGGGGGQSGTSAGAGANAPANSGAGGGGAGASTSWSSVPCPGGGAGEYVEILISSVAASYAYTVGASGAGGAGTSAAGGAGGSGVIIIEEHYT